MQQTWKRVVAFVNSDYFWWVFILLGIFLRIRQYLLNRSLWGDEASLALNLVNRSFGELTQLLDYHQAAPIGFLFIEKLSILIFGNHEYIMRLFPLFAGILAIYFIYRFARTHLGTFGLFAVAIFAISWWLVYHSSELKQYTSDVMIALLLVFLAGGCLRESIRAKDFLVLGILGSIVIWISHPSVFILAGIGLVLVLEKFSRKDYAPWTWILAIGIVWLISFGLEYLVSLRHIVADEYLIKYWQKAYVPTPPWSNMRWYVGTFYSFVFFAFHRADNVMAISTLVLAFIGTISLWLRDRKIALLVILPFVMTGIASLMQRYPLKNRFMLFLVPFTLLLMAEGFRGIYWVIAKWKRKYAVIICTLLALAVIWQIVPITYERANSGRKEDIRSVIEYVAENRSPNETVYVFFKTIPVFNYYAPFYNLDTSNIIRGNFRGSKRTTKRTAIKGFQDDVDMLVGEKRIWYIFSEVVDCPACEEEDTLSFYLDYINKFGTVIDSFDGSGANAYLYDMRP